VGKLDALDDFQQRHRATAFLWAVQKKYSDDQGGYLAALVTYYGFLSIFPMLLAAFTIAAYVLAGDKSAITTIEHHLGTYPIIGPAVTDLAGQRLQGSPVALIVGVLGLIWGAQGLAQAAEYTMNEAWNIPARDRAGFVPRLARGLAWYALFGLGMLASTFIASLGSIFKWSGGPTLSALIAAAFDAALFLASFRVLSPPVATRRQLLPGAVVAGVVWSILTGVGIGLAHNLAHTNSLYGSFAPVLGLLAFLYLGARVTIYSIEANVVYAHHLWPRSITSSRLVEADREQLENLARRQERVSDQQVQVNF
jgi:YihY family inner membrane protein